MAIKVQETMSCSERSVCRWLGLNRSTLRYTPKPVPDKTKLLEAEIVKMSKRYPCFGYRKITRKLVEEGWAVGKKQAQHRNHVWAWDFVSDYTVRGGKLRVFNLIDEFTKECHCIHSDRAIKATDVLTVLQEAIEEHGAPEYIRSDNGPEFIATAIQKWLRENGIKTIYIDPGCPWQNGYVESFNDKFRRECLNRELIYTLSESRVIFADYRTCITMKGRIALWAYSRPKHMPNNSPAYLAPVGLRPPSAR